MSARRRMSAAAKRGDRDAQFALAEHYDLEAPRRPALAARWYQRAAEQGRIEAQNAWAVCLRDGDGVPVDRSQAVHWFRKAASKGNVLANLHLGVALFEGDGTCRDPCGWRKAHLCSLGRP